MELDLNRLDNEPIFRAIARAVEQSVLGGVLKPGDRLPSEMGIARQLGVNRSSVREAIRLLEQNGLVRREQGKRKLRVSVPSTVDLSKAVSAAMILRKVTFENLWEAMYALEPAAAAGAAARRDDTVLAAIEANIARTEQSLDDSSSVAELDVEFHDLIARAAGNGAIELARQPLSQIFYPAFFSVISSLNAGPRLLFAHRTIFEAIKDRDGPRAFTWMQKHIKDFKRGYSLANLSMDSPIHQPAPPPSPGLG